MILVTGANGYLGRHVVQSLRSIGISAYSAMRSTCDLTKSDAVASLLMHVRPNAVIHCAAVVPKAAAEYDDWYNATLSAEMTAVLVNAYDGPIVYASSLTAATPTSAYALGKRIGEQTVAMKGGLVMRLPGLFGLPRRTGVIYEAARAGVIPDSFGPYPAMHVSDAAEYLVRAATMPSHGNREPFSVTYGNERLEACFGSLGVTFNQRVRELVEALQRESVV